MSDQNMTDPFLCFSSSCFFFKTSVPKGTFVIEDDIDDDEAIKIDLTIIATKEKRGRSGENLPIQYWRLKDSSHDC